MELQQAYFEILDLKKPNKVLEKLKVQYNPTDLSFTKGAQFAEIAIPGLDSPILQFIRGSTETLNLELFFDTTDNGMGETAKSVTEETDKIYRLVKQERDTHAPPICRFSWGASPAASAGEHTKEKDVSYAPFWFTGIVDSIDRKFLLFNPEGVPLRARLTVKMREYKTIEQMVANLQSPDHTKARVLKRRERLEQLSDDEYDTPTEWRRIAEKNELDDPRRVPPGTLLEIPPLVVESVIRR
ncbi:MAG: CIS tube protein [bacterium]